MLLSSKKESIEVDKTFSKKVSIQQSPIRSVFSTNIRIRISCTRNSLTKMLQVQIRNGMELSYIHVLVGLQVFSSSKSPMCVPVCQSGIDKLTYCKEHPTAVQPFDTPACLHHLQ